MVHVKRFLRVCHDFLETINLERLIALLEIANKIPMNQFANKIFPFANCGVVTMLQGVLGFS